METINLHYAKVELDENEDIIEYKFKSHSELVKAIEFICSDINYHCIWLLAKNESTDIFISEHKDSIIEFIKNKSGWNEHTDYFLQEYHTFSDAYDVALMMHESSSDF